MDSLNFVNLIQAATFSVGLLGGILIWSTKPNEYKGVALLLWLTAFAASINILEETGITRDIYLVSPVFILLFAPATYLAIKLLIEKKLGKHHLWHLAPVIPLLLITSYVSFVIAVGTIWRVVYAILTAYLLIQYKKTLDNERSDADEFSLKWMVWVLILTATINLLDLVRLNVQTVIPYELNVFGQGVSNLAWLISSMYTIVKLQSQGRFPSHQVTTDAEPENSSSIAEDERQHYQSLFNHIDAHIQSTKLFLTPRLTLTNVSEEIGLQTREVSRAINIICDKSFNQYINHFRVEHVCEQLQLDASQSLLSLSEQAGFNSKASFNHVFKLSVGQTPSEYKRSLV